MECASLKVVTSCCCRSIQNFLRLLIIVTKEININVYLVYEKIVLCVIAFLRGKIRQS